MNIVHFAIPGEFVDRFSCDPRVAVTGFEVTKDAHKVTCLNCIRTHSFKEAEKNQ